MPKNKPKELSPIQQARQKMMAPTPSGYRKKPRSGLRQPSSSLKRNTKLKTFGVKGKRQNRKYEQEKHLHFIKHPYCHLCLRDGIRNDGDRTLHHKAGRAGALLWYRPLFLTTCLHHHRYIHDNTDEAVENGWIVRLTKAEEDTINKDARKLGYF